MLFLLFSCAAHAVIAFWDGGHMLVGQVAMEYMESSDIQVIHPLLSHWEQDFPNMNEIPTATVWADMIKCHHPAVHCPSPLMPSMQILNQFHFAAVAVARPNSSLETIFRQVKGQAHRMLEDALQSFATSQSLWSANFMLRFLLHVFGDIHQPLHTSLGVSSDFPHGDRGGHSYVFEPPCAFSNLHMLWDALGGAHDYDWNTTMSPSTRARMVRDARQLIHEYPIKNDSLFLQSQTLVDFPTFLRWAQEKYLFRQIVRESSSMALSNVYAALNLTLNENNRIECPTNDYIAMAIQVAEERIHLGGHRLAQLLTRLAHQIRRLNLLR